MLTLALPFAAPLLFAGAGGTYTPVGVLVADRLTITPVMPVQLSAGEQELGIAESSRASVRLVGLRDTGINDGALVATARVRLTVVTRDGAAVSGGTDLGMSAVAGTPGDYTVSLPPSLATAGARYRLRVLVEPGTAHQLAVVTAAAVRPYEGTG